MGFINFMKKSNKETLPEPPMNNLDEPPAPPGFDMPEEGFDDLPPSPPSIDDENFSNPPEPGSLPDFPEVDYDEPMEMNEQQVINHVGNKKVTVEHDDFFETNEDNFETENEEPIMDHDEAILEPRQYDTTRPIFILADNFQKILGRIKTTKEMLKELENNVFTFNELKTKEDKKFHQLKTKMEDIQRKLIYVDKSLFENR